MKYRIKNSSFKSVINWVLLLSFFVSATAGCKGSVKGSLTVIVIDQQLLPMKGVSITLKSGLLQGKLKRLTAENGRCLFSSLPPGSDYVLNVRKKGFLPQTRDKIKVIAGENKNLRITLIINQEVTPGRWRIARSPGEDTRLTARQKAEKHKLETLAYLAGHNVNTNKKNVTHCDKKRAYNGLNLYCSGHGPEAILMDMKGNRLHHWRYEMKRVWKDKYNPMIPEHQFWRRVHLGENGDLFAIFEGYGLIKLDKNSNLIWGYRGKAHHDLFIMPDGKIYVLTRKASLNPKYHKKNLILDDFITVLSPGGEVIQRVSILECLENSNYKTVLKKIKGGGDILHTNTIEVLNGKLSHKSPAFKQGNVLISILYLHLIGVVDMEKKSVVWAMSGMWRLQHQPSILDNGNMLIFDNLWDGKKQSRVFEFDPFTKQIVWEYHGTEENPFYSFDCGSCQRLANGNTLISETNSGRAFEVTRDRTIVWEFYTPHRTGNNNELVASLFEVVRIGSEYNTDWLNSSL